MVDSSAPVVTKDSKFDYKALDYFTKRAAESSPDLNIDHWCGMLTQYVKMFKAMGSAMSIAFEDISSKVGILERNKGIHKDITDGIIFSYISKEGELGLQKCNGDNNKKTAPSKDWLKYESCKQLGYGIEERGGWLLFLIGI